MHLPDPVGKVKINVKQRPGLSYPHPPNRAWVTEETIHPHVHYSHKHFGVPPEATHYHMGHKKHHGGLLGGAGY
jgi:hypothetical protein